MASVIANEFSEATGDLYLSALVEVGLALFLVTIIVNIVAQLLVWTSGNAWYSSEEPCLKRQCFRPIFQMLPSACGGAA